MRAFATVAGFVVVVTAAVLAIVVVLSAGNRTAWSDLEVGECFDLAGALDDNGGAFGDVTAVETVACSESHDAEVVAVGELNPTEERSYPSEQDVLADVDRACAAQTPDSVDPERYGILPIVPDERTWTDRQGRFVCVAVVRGGGTISGSALP